MKAPRRADERYGACVLSLRISSGVAQRGAPTPRTVGFLSAAKAIAAAGALAGAFALAGCNSAVNGNYYQDEAPDGLNNTNPAGTSFGKDNSGMLAKRMLTGVGILEPTKPPIDYTPRSPLCCRPTLDPADAGEQGVARTGGRQAVADGSGKEGAARAGGAVADPTQQLTAAMKSGQVPRPIRFRRPAFGWRAQQAVPVDRGRPPAVSRRTEVGQAEHQRPRQGQQDRRRRPEPVAQLSDRAAAVLPRAGLDRADADLTKNVFQVWNLQQDNSPQSRNPTVKAATALEQFRIYLRSEVARC